MMAAKRCNKTEKRLFIFDLDGTLADAYTAIHRSMNYTLKKMGHPPVSYSLVKKKVGKGDRLFIQTFLEPAEMEEGVKVYRGHHEKALFRYSRLRPHARRALYLLKKRGKLIAVASNRPRRFTNILLKKLRIGKYLDFVLCADDNNGGRKPDPKMLNEIVGRFKVRKAEAVYFGDMDIDMETAKRAGIDAVFIRGGSSGLRAVRKYRKKVIGSPKEIPGLFRA